MIKQDKNYVGFVNDHSGSMSGLRHAAMADYNANIKATKDAANAEMLDTVVVSVVGIGVGDGVQRQVIISNPHVLKPVTSWVAQGGTPLWTGTLNLINLFENLPDAKDPHVSFLIIVTTDGQATDGHKAAELRSKIEEKQRLGNWTFVFRVPLNSSYRLEGMGIPAGNITEWDTTAAGMAASTVQTQVAMSTYYATRSAGAKSSNTFYTSTAGVDTSKLTDISKETSLYVVGSAQEGMWIKDFILIHRMEYLIGAGFYQLTKTEARVSPTKLILIRDKKTGAVYAGPDARKMLGLDTVNNARLNPNHGNGDYDIFIQSESVNRKLQAGSGVLYWASKGRKMTQADLDKYAPKPVVPAVPQLIPAPATGRPTPSPIPKTKSADTVDGKPVKFFAKRDEARAFATSNRLPKGSLGDLAARANPNERVTGANGMRWFVYL